MLLKSTLRFSGERLCLRKFCLIIISFALVSVQTFAQKGWTKKTNMPQRGGGGSCIYENKIYLIGGSGDGPSYTPLNYNQVYDPATDTWELKTPAPTGHNFHAVAFMNDTIYVIGGGYPTYNLKIEAYHPATDTWKTKKNMTRGWLSGKGVVLNGKIYLIGGNYNGHECWAYDPITEEWTIKTPLPTDGGGVTSTIAYNGLIYAFGGSNYSPWSAKSVVYAYNPQTDTWTKKKDMPTARFALGTYEVNGLIYAIGGSSYEPNSIANVEVYDPINDTWSQGVNIPVSLGWFSGEVVNNKIYVMGGTANWSTTKSEVWEYDPEFPTGIEQEQIIKSEFVLYQNYPNPFNPTTKIGYILQEKSNAKLTLLNALGEEIAVLLNEEQEKGYHKVEFDGSKLTSGVYFYQLRAGNFVETKKMILLR